jgi:ParB family transcriptional regulator, chromosome partitioning protein
MKRPKGLGRGLDALLGSEGPAAEEGGSLRSVPVAQLRPGKYQPRTHMNGESLAELAESIKAQGVMQPILVRPLAEDLFEIIAGERRFRASQLAGLVEVPVLVKKVPDEAALVMALIENIQREDLNPLEEALGVQRLLDEFGFTHEQAARAIGRSRSATSNLLRLLNLAKPVQELLASGQLDMGHARALLALDTAGQVLTAQQIMHKGMSVRDAESLVTGLVRTQAGDAPGAGAKGGKRLADRGRDVRRLEEELADTLGATVQLLANAAGKGRLVIQFSSLDQLDGIIRKIGGSG